MLRGPAALLLLLLPPADPRSLPPLGFIGPFGPRSRVQASASSAPQPAGRGLDREEVRTLLKGRTAIVVAADTLDIGLSVAEGLAALGANVVFASRAPSTIPINFRSDFLRPMGLSITAESMPSRPSRTGSVPCSGVPCSSVPCSAVPCSG